MRTVVAYTYYSFIHHCNKRRLRVAWERW